ncbi:MAG: hypothetical protein ACRC9R_10395 [Enterovibrio sp.]
MAVGGSGSGGRNPPLNNSGNKRRESLDSNETDETRLLIERDSDGSPSLRDQAVRFVRNISINPLTLVGIIAASSAIYFGLSWLFGTPSSNDLGSNNSPLGGPHPPRPLNRHEGYGGEVNYFHEIKSVDEILAKAGYSPQERITYKELCKESKLRSRYSRWRHGLPSDAECAESVKGSRAQGTTDHSSKGKQSTTQPPKGSRTQGTTDHSSKGKQSTTQPPKGSRTQGTTGHSSKGKQSTTQPPKGSSAQGTTDRSSQGDSTTTQDSSKGGTQSTTKETKKPTFKKPE